MYSRIIVLILKEMFGKNEDNLLINSYEAMIKRINLHRAKQIID